MLVKIDDDLYLNPSMVKSVTVRLISETKAGVAVDDFYVMEFDGTELLTDDKRNIRAVKFDSTGLVSDEMCSVGNLSSQENREFVQRGAAVLSARKYAAELAAKLGVRKK